MSSRCARLAWSGPTLDQSDEKLFDNDRLHGSYKSTAPSFMLDLLLNLLIRLEIQVDLVAQLGGEHSLMRRWNLWLLLEHLSSRVTLTLLYFSSDLGKATWCFIFCLLHHRCLSSRHPMLGLRSGICRCIISACVSLRLYLMLIVVLIHVRTLVTHLLAILWLEHHLIVTKVSRGCVSTRLAESMRMLTVLRLVILLVLSVTCTIFIDKVIVLEYFAIPHINLRDLLAVDAS